MEIEQGALHLRFRDDAATSHAFDPPAVEAFLRAGPEPAGPRLDGGVGVVPGAGPIDPDGPIVVFMQHPEFGIPAPGHDHTLPDLATWSVRPTTFGYIATVAPPTRGASPRRAAQILAGCLAFTVPAATSAAPAIPAPAGTASAPATARPSTPAPAPAKAPATAPANQPAPAPAPASPTPAPPTVAEPPPPGPATATKEWTPDAMPAPPPPRIQVSTAVSDAAWEGVDGIVVIVELKGGKVLRGRVGAVQAETFTLIDATDGQILVVPKSGVTSLRAHVPPPIPTQTGTGLIAGGSILLALGVPVFITGITFVAICPSCTYLHLPMLIVGGGALGGGIPMISRGIQRRNAFQRAMIEQQVAPIVTRTPYNGWVGGLQFRF
jgi:hypothetical protein